MGEFGSGDNVTIYIGSYLVFEKVVIKEVNPVFDTRVTREGWPISAEVSVVFETYEILTKEVLLDKVFQKAGGLS